MTYSKMVKEAIYMLETDGELFVDMVNELDSWNGYADGYRAYPMWELDDLFCDCKVSDFLSKLAPGFNLRDEYMVDTIYGLDSTDDIETWYRDNTSPEEVFDSVVDNFNNLYFNNPEFESLISDIVNYSDDEEESPISGIVGVVDAVLSGSDADPVAVPEV